MCELFADNALSTRLFAATNADHALESSFQENNVASGEVSLQLIVPPVGGAHPPAVHVVEDTAGGFGNSVVVRL